MLLVAPSGYGWLAPLGITAVAITDRLANSIRADSERRVNSGAEALLVGIVAVGLFVWPFANRNTPHSVTLLTLWLAVLIQGAWAIRRFATLTARERGPLLFRVRQGIRFGMGYAALFSILAIALSALIGEPGRFSLLGVMAAYIIGGVLTGTVVGCGLYLVRWPLGAMLLGILGAIPVFEAILLLLPVIKPDVAVPSLGVRMALACVVALLIGPLAGLVVRAQLTDA